MLAWNRRKCFQVQLRRASVAPPQTLLHEAMVFQPPHEVATGQRPLQRWAAELAAVAAWASPGNARVAALSCDHLFEVYRSSRSVTVFLRGLAVGAASASGPSPGRRSVLHAR